MVDQPMSEVQLGYLRHFDNVSRRQPNDWTFMNGRAPGQLDFGSYRFQLSYMAYAAALAHVHRAPAAPGAFKETIARLIRRLMEPEVWMYWRDASRAGGIGNPHLAGSEEQWDPVGRDNIMYSAYLQSLTLLFDVLFDDHRFADPEALSFEFNTMFWGDGGEHGGLHRRFAYDQYSLNETLYWKMVENGYLGIACEPNCVFQICNQPAILGFRMHDMLTGDSRGEEVVRGYRQAWDDFGGPVAPNGHLYMFAMQDSRTPIPNFEGLAWGDTWYCALANTWNSDFVRDFWGQVRDEHVLRGPDGTMSCQIPGPQEYDNDTCDFGWLAICASEMGDEEILDGLSRHAERFMRPMSFDGGRLFAREDRLTDEEGNYTRMEALTGNSLLAYASLNVPDGMRALYQQPWPAGHFEEPNLSDVSDVVAVAAARYDGPRGELTMTLQRQPERSGAPQVGLANVWGRGPWTLSKDGAELATGDEHDVSSSQGPVVRRDDRLWLDDASPGAYALRWQRP